jgi:hypothetical protein
MTKQEQIDKIMDEFNFAAVLEYMDSVNWNWTIDDIISKRPTETDLRKTARRLLTKLGDSCKGVRCGGFIAICIDGDLELYFAIQSCINTPQ